MLNYKAAQVIACTKEEPKPWEFGGRSGVSHTARLAVLGAKGGVAEIKLKAKTEDELKAKVAKYTIGKGAEIEVLEIIPVFKQGDRRPSSYEYVA